MSAFRRLYRGYGLLLRTMGVVSALATFVMMALVVANILGRYLLNKPVTGTLEFTEVAPRADHFSFACAHAI